MSFDGIINAISKGVEWYGNNKETISTIVDTGTKVASWFQNSNTNSTSNTASDATLQRMANQSNQYQLYIIYLKEGGCGDITSPDFQNWAQSCPYTLKSGSSTYNALTNNLNYYKQ